MKNTLSTLALAVAMILSGLGIGSSSADSVRVETKPVPAPLVIGDEIARKAKDELLERRPGWRVNGVRLRPVRMLVPVLRWEKERAGSTPDRLVIALGSHPAGAKAFRYSWAEDMLDVEATVVLVTAYRDPKVVGRDRASATARAARQMKRFSTYRDHVCVADWRRVAKRNPDLLEDGVHPTARGEEVWSRMVARTMERCVSGDYPTMR